MQGPMLGTESRHILSSTASLKAGEVQKAVKKRGEQAKRLKPFEGSIERNRQRDGSLTLTETNMLTLTL